MEVPIDSLRGYTASKLPTYRHPNDVLSSSTHGQSLLALHTKEGSIPSIDGDERPSSPPAGPSHGLNQHTRNKSAGAQLTTHEDVRRMIRQSTFLSPKSDILPPPTPAAAAADDATSPKCAKPRTSKGRYPPLSMITQRRGQFCEPSEVDLPYSTTNWVTQQQIQSMTTLDSAENPPGIQGLPEQKQEHEHRLSRSLTEPVPARPLIKPIRGFKLSSQRKSTEMASRRTSYNDTDNTLRALEGRHDNAFHAPTQSEQQDEHNSDESDLFLRAAREEELQARTGMNSEAPHRTSSLRARAPSGSSMAFQHYPEVRDLRPTLYTFLLLSLTSDFLSSEAMCGLWLALIY